MNNLQLNTTNTGFSEEQISAEFEKLKAYISELQADSDLTPVNSPFKEDILLEVNNSLEKFKSEKLKYIFLIGIGGSNLGTQAIYEALTDKLNLNFPKILFLDTIDSNYMHSLFKFLDSNLNSKEEFVVNLISKSGNTTESIVNFEILNNYLKRRFENISDHIVITTDKDSGLYNLAKAKSYQVLEIPKKVGGRFSVFTAVGLFPLGLCNINISELLNGARSAAEIALKTDLNENLVAISAANIYLNNKNGKSILNSFFFAPELEYIGKWYKQLVGESTGKRLDLDGNEVRTGLTPIISIGSTDLHSMAQLYLGGKSDKYTNFISIKIKNNFKMPENLEFEGLVDVIKNKDSETILQAIYQGVKTTYIKENLPFSEIIFEDVSEYSLGEFLQFRMIEIIFLCKLLNVNAFNQPEVEEYKKETRKILGA